MNDGEIVLLCPTDKEYKMFIYYDKHVGSKLSSIFGLVKHAIDDGSWQFLDLKNIKLSIDDDFKYLNSRRYYEQLKTWANGKLSYDENGFHLDGHDFETLNEVQRALENKAFL